jgi:long-chain acyl-CoA synthetase
MIASIADYLKKTAAEYPRQEALIFQEKRLSYGELNKRVNALTHALLKMGIKSGERVSLLMEDCHQHFELYFVAAKGNFILNPVNYRLSSSEIDYIIKDAGSKILIFAPNFRNVVDDLKKGKHKVKHFITLGEKIGDEYEYNELIAENSNEEPKINYKIEDPFCLMYTSGTTGFPKGVVLTNKNFVASAENMSSDFSVVHSDVCLHVTPIFHAAVGMPLCHVVKGCKNILLPKFDPELFLKTVGKERVTFTFLVSTMLIAILNSPDIGKYNLKSMRTICIGAAPVPIEPLKKGIEIFGNVFFQTYGLTEGTCVANFMNLKKEFNPEEKEKNTKKLSSIGKGIPKVRMRVVDSHDKDVLPDEIGEIIIKGATVMKEYWRKPEETAGTIRGGWLHTGDLATVDKEGWIYITDRKKDMIISGGENIYPKEVENVLYTHPAVNEAAVFGVPDEKWGESVKALVTVKRGYDVTEEELIDHCKNHLASYKKPKSIEFVSELKKTASGKIDKRKMREPYWTDYEKRV